MLEQLGQALEHFIATYGYLAIFLTMFVEEAGVPLPLPNEVVLMYAGYLAYKGELDANLTGLVATLGAANGSALLYIIARRGGRPLLRRYGRFIRLEEEGLARAERWVQRYGMVSIPVARLTPGLRIYTTVIAGILRVPYRVVVAAVVGASLIWSFFWVHLGKALGDNWEKGAQAFERAGRWGFGIVVAIVLAALLWRWFRRRRAAGNNAAGKKEDKPAGLEPHAEPEPES